jgi:hypothetical protein
VAALAAATFGEARASGTCDVGALAAGIDGLHQLDPVERVARSAGALEVGCRGFGRALEAAGDVSVVSPERRRSLDLALGARDDLWRELCPAGPRALRESARMSHRDGRAHLWDECGLADQPELAGITREEWVERLEGMLILPLEAAVILREIHDADLSEIVVRGLVGLAPRSPAPRPVPDPATDEPEVADAAPEGGELNLDEVLAQMPDSAPDPAPVPEPVPVSVPVPAVPAPAVPLPAVPLPAVPVPAPVAVPAPAVPAPAPVAAPAPARDVAAAPDVAAVPAVAEESEPHPPKRAPPVVRARFKDGGKSRPKWSKEALANGGSCVVRIRVGANGKMQKITFLECPDALKSDVHVAAERSRYLPASDGEYPVPGAFRTKWAVE